MGTLIYFLFKLFIFDETVKDCLATSLILLIKAALLKLFYNFSHFLFHMHNNLEEVVIFFSIQMVNWFCNVF